ncbi:Protein bimA [Escovopsis weberi]|uniref:Protein bimA n=1 Tax=Escovopsis weberi TaxID=150374 RepID=A0A0M8N2R8_ESCWE|nr:Protein bimA [Escovopsis weberi]
MAPSQVGSLLRQVVYYHLDNGSYDNALFFAERFATQDPRSSDAAYLFSLCHLRLGDHRSAYDVSKPMGSRGNPACAWVLAQACLELGRHKEGIAALEKSRSSWIQKNLMGKHSATSRAAHHDGPAVLCLLGKLYRAYDEQTKSISCFEDALKINPFQWDAFKALCDMGVKVRVPNIFKSSEGLVHCLSQDTAAAATIASLGTVPGSFDASQKKPSSQRSAGPDSGIDPFSAGFSSSDLNPLGDSQGANTTTTESDFISRMQSSRARLAASMPTQLDADAMGTPTGPVSEDPPNSRPNAHQEPPQAPSRRTRNTQAAVDSPLEAPPRMDPRLAARKHASARDKTQGQAGEQHVADNSGALNSYSRMGTIAPGDRKRTLSGHPASRLPNNNEELGTRRSARLTRPSTRATSTITNIGPPATRELKKARPQVSRIVRPASGASNVGRVVSGNRKPLEDHPTDEQYEVPKMTVAPPPPAAPKPAEPDTSKLEEALRWTMDLLKKLGTGYHLMAQFQCQEAMQALSTLPSSHQGSPWVLAVMGRAYYELAQYADAEKYFRRMRAQAPSRLEDMEVYSTTLWHLKRETDLSFLAHELVDSSWHSPQAWCALGNAWSLTRDPEQALRCFKRATQLDPNFAYGFTLQGHEFVANEEYDKALTAYRQAITADKRHYNAYYGIGRVQQRLGAYDKALTHFQAALVINPNNAVLVCCIGTALEKQKQILPALRAYTKAVELAPRAASTRYKKARALLAAGQIEEAQKELLILKDLAPDEGTVHFLLATLYRSMNEKQLAVRHFTIALALDPKAGSQIKEAIESFEDDVQMDDSTS